MRLLFISRVYYPATRYGGPVVSLRRICSMLVEAGHEVVVVCSNMASPGMKGERLRAGSFDMDGVKVRFLETPVRFHWEGLSWPALREVPREVSRADIVHIAGTRHFLGIIAETASRRRNIPYFVMPEGSVPPRSRNVLGKTVFDALYTRSALAHAFRVIGWSDQESQDLLSWGIRPERLLIPPPRGDVVEGSPRPSDELRAERELPPDLPILLWMGRIHSEKGLPLLLEAMTDPRLSHAHLLLAGDGEDRALVQSLRDQVARGGMGDRVRFMGWVEEEEKAELLKLADLFVFPSRKESFGLAAAEAISSGLPVVLTKDCGIAPLIDGVGGVVCEYGARPLADAISGVLEDRNLLAKLREGTQDVAKQLNWPPVVSFLEDAYASAHENLAAR